MGSSRGREHGTSTPARTELDRYDAAAQQSSQGILRHYSTSFSLATGTLPASMRPDIAAVYGLVRIADELVDGAAAQAGLTPEQIGLLLRELEADVARATELGYSANPIAHAFARTARENGIGEDLVAPFFASMRMDLEITEHTDESLAHYIHGSAEVIGLMCLRVFLHRSQLDHRYEQLAPAAIRLGAAFQKINFLRDLRADTAELGRSYFPGIDARSLSDTQKDALIADIREDLAVARTGLTPLPFGARRAVRLAHDLFAELTTRMDSVSAAELTSTRISVPAWRKAALAARAVADRTPDAEPGP